VKHHPWAVAVLVAVIIGGLATSVWLLRPGRPPAAPCTSPTSGEGAPAADVAGPISTSSGQAEDYWTPERMRGASGAARPDSPEIPPCR
jgi:hypothetical protein